jgi:hypothetical protein
VPEEGLLIHTERHYQLRQFRSCYVGLIGTYQCIGLKKSMGYVFVLFLSFVMVFVNLISLLYCTNYLFFIFYLFYLRRIKMKEK